MVVAQIEVRQASERLHALRHQIQLPRGKAFSFRCRDMFERTSKLRPDLALAQSSTRKVEVCQAFERKSYTPAPDPTGARGSVECNDAVKSCRPATVTFSRPLLKSFAPVTAGAATSHRTADVPAMAPGAARLSLSGRGVSSF